MPTWDELQAHARKTYTLSLDESDYFGLVFSYSDGRSQQIVVARFQAYEKDWIRFRTFVCAEADLNLRVALRKNEGFTIGALALDADGDFCLQHTAQLATLDPEEFEVALGALAGAADTLEEEHSGKDTY
jgi:hypothetical protein